MNNVNDWFDRVEVMRMLPTVTARPSGLSPMAMIQDLTRSLERVLQDGSGPRRSSWIGARPSAEMFETDDAVRLRIEAPGYDPDDFDIEIENRMLTVSARRETAGESGEEGVRTWVREWALEEWERSFALPMGAEQDDVRAVYERGVLEITVPKAPEARPRRIRIAAGGKRRRLFSGQKEKNAD